MTIRLRSRLLGAHVHMTVFMGADADHLQNSGTLVMGVEQWFALTEILAAGQLAVVADRRLGPATAALHFDDKDDPRLTMLLNDRIRDRVRQMPAEPVAPPQEDEPCPRPADDSPTTKSTAS